MRRILQAMVFVAVLAADTPARAFLIVPGEEAAAFRFTSALPVQVLKGMSSILLPHLQPNLENNCSDASYLNPAT